jgi:hypothetical protein
MLCDCRYEVLGHFRIICSALTEIQDAMVEEWLAAQGRLKEGKVVRYTRILTLELQLMGSNF